MLAGTREIRINGQKVADTPAIIPSFSSKGFPEVSKIIEVLSESIAETGILVSAYDIAKKHIATLPQYAEYFILDSGGYECSDYRDFSDHNMHNYENTPWAYKELVSVLDAWNSKTQTISVSYDHPKVRDPLNIQIEKAKKQFDGRNFGRLLLVKPNTKDSVRINFDDIKSHIYEFRHFDVIGFTEKELGYSIYDRMKNIAKIRAALNKANINIPIHIFGSLDTISTPLYFLSGADIFDGLTWLRYSYSAHSAVYLRNASAIKYGLRENDSNIEPKIWAENYQTLLNMRLAMKRFLRENNFGVFGEHSSLFENAIGELYADIGD